MGAVLDVEFVFHSSGDVFILFISSPESLMKSILRSGGWKFLLIGLSKKRGIVQIFFFLCLNLVCRILFTSNVYIRTFLNNLWGIICSFLTIFCLLKIGNAFIVLVVFRMNWSFVFVSEWSMFFESVFSGSLSSFVVS